MARGQRSVGENKSSIVRALPAACADETKAVEFIEGLRWGDSPACPRCGGVQVRQMLDREGNRSKRFLWRCQGCKKQFTVRIGTIFEDSRIPLHIWCHAFWRACSSKKGVSAFQIQRETGLSYKSALFLMHRIRFSMGMDHDTPPKLSGTVEADETYVGGKPRYHTSKKDPNRQAKRRAMLDAKAPIFAVVERGGQVRASTMTTVNKDNVGRELRRVVDFERTRLITDEASVYSTIGPEFSRGHETVNHGRKEYVRPGTDIHSNTIEGFFSLIKRGVYGTFHSVSKKHLHLYVNEFEFRYNHRFENDGERTAAAIQQSEGKRLRYRS